jgi:hypothetical protein
MHHVNSLACDGLNNLGAAKWREVHIFLEGGYGTCVSHTRIVNEYCRSESPLK